LLALARWQNLYRRNPQFLDRPAIIQRLGSLSRDRHPEVRQQALRLLGCIPNRAVLPFLRAALHRDLGSQKAAAQALAQLRHLPAAAPARLAVVYVRRSRKVASL
jgi:HEAT repeat protein